MAFGVPPTNGGAGIIGYRLERDEGIVGSPYSIIFNGTGQPELVSFEVTGLLTARTYAFKLFALNKIFASSTPATANIIIGTIADRPQNIVRVAATYVSGEIPIAWEAPSHSGGVELTSYELWHDDGLGDFSTIVAAVATPGPYDTTFTLSGLTPQTTYGLKMRSVNSIGTSIDSDIVYLICASIPATPSPPTAESATKESITLAWNVPTSVD